MPRPRKRGILRQRRGSRSSRTAAPSQANAAVREEFSTNFVPPPPPAILPPSSRHNRHQA
ncbi:hypothetical protein MMC12_008678 [Toensbergia leucococca]|nr:hypothetical protein [Toensbergia leucococca]